jgi:2-desacetyl-2-hydroxyethyl bacteriochlorophyllide A dehydrogenase
MSTTATRIVFPERNRVALEEFDLPPVGPNQVLLRTRWSLVSSGTELVVLRGRFEPGTHWDGYGRYPFHPGYSAVGEILAAGTEVSDVSVGDLVVARVGHASHHVTDALGCTRVPDGVDLQQATWFALAKVALMGVRVADFRLGADVLTVGAGPLGQMVVRWAHAAGAGRNVVIESVGLRRELAQSGGATAALGVALAERDSIIAACGGQQPEYVVDATGNADVLSAVLPLVATRGRVVILGNTGSPSAQRLTDDVVTRALQIAGAHDVLSMLDAPWDGDRGLHELFFHLVRTGRFDLDGLITDVVSPVDPDAAYAAAERPDQTLGVCFDWADR